MRTPMSDPNMLESLLKATLSTNQHEIKSAERKLAALTNRPEFLQNLLEIIFSTCADSVLSLSATILFKNFIENHWTSLDMTNLSEEIRTQIRERMLGLYISTHAQTQIQKQFLKIILIIASNDFPLKWHALIINIKDLLQDKSLNCDQTCALLKLTQNLFRKYSHEDYSSELWQEIKYVLEIFSAAFFAKFGEVITNIYNLYQHLSNNINNNINLSNNVNLSHNLTNNNNLSNNLSNNNALNNNLSNNVNLLQNNINNSNFSNNNVNNTINNEIISNFSNLASLLQQLKYLIKIFYYLTAQELPDIFLETKEIYFDSFIKILKFNLNNININNLSNNVNNNSNVNVNSSNSSVNFNSNAIVTNNSNVNNSDFIKLSELNEKSMKFLIKSKILILKISALFLRKYTADFENLMPQIMEAVWEICTTKPPNDSLSKTIDENGFESNLMENLSAQALNFIRATFSTSSIRSLFDKDDNIMNLCGNIIIPNLMPTEADLDLFNEEPAQFVRMEIEGEIGSRRAQASDLASSLSFTYENRVISIFMRFISELVVQGQDGNNGWKYRDVALRLIIAAANKFGAVKFGSSEISPLMDINKIYTEMVVPILSQTNLHPLLLASALKYLIVFRKSIDNNLIDSSFNILLPLMSNELAIQYLVFILLEDVFLPPEHVHFNTRFQKLISLLPNIYQYLLATISTHTIHLCQIPFRFLNSIMLKTHSFSKDHLGAIIHALISLTREFSTPTNDPAFSFYVSESFSLALRMLHIHDQPSFLKISAEILNPLISYFVESPGGVIGTDQFIQVISIIISKNTSLDFNNLTNLYKIVFNEEIWEGDVNHLSSVTILAGSFLKSFPYIAMNQNSHIFLMNTFIKYSSNIRYDSVVFSIINPLVIYLPWVSSGVKFPLEIFQSIFKRLTTLKKPKFVSGFSDFIYHFVSVMGPEEFVTHVETVQNLIIFKILKSILLGEISQPISILRKKCLMIISCDILVVLASRRTYSNIEIKDIFLSLYASHPPTNPIINVDREKYYKTLGNTDQDLVPLFEGFNENCSGLIKYALPLYDHHIEIYNVKSYIKDKFVEIKKYLDFDTGQFIQHQIETIS